MAKTFILLKKCVLMIALCFIGISNALAEDVTATLEFSTSKTKIDKASVTAEDSQGNEWTITTTGTSSYTANKDYYQIGSSKAPHHT